MSKISGGVRVLPTIHENFRLGTERSIGIAYSPQEPLASKPPLPYGLVGRTPQSRRQGTKPLPRITARGSSTLTSPVAPNAARQSAAIVAPKYATETTPTIPSFEVSDAPGSDPSVPKRRPVMGVGFPNAPDVNFDTDKVVALNLYNFKKFTRGLGKALIMFYSSETPNTGTSALANEIAIAAERYPLENSGFGAVDCFLDQELCSREGACSTPLLKLYSNGHQISCLRETKDFSAYQMYTLMKLTPDMKKPLSTSDKAPPRRRMMMGTSMMRK